MDYCVACATELEHYRRKRHVDSKDHKAHQKHWVSKSAQLNHLPALPLERPASPSEVFLSLPHDTFHGQYPSPPPPLPPSAYENRIDNLCEKFGESSFIDELLVANGVNLCHFIPQSLGETSQAENGKHCILLYMFKVNSSIFSLSSDAMDVGDMSGVKSHTRAAAEQKGDPNWAPWPDKQVGLATFLKRYDAVH